MLGRMYFKTFFSVTFALIFILLSVFTIGKYSIFIFGSYASDIPNNEILQNTKNACYQKGLSEYNKLIASYSFKRGGLMLPKINFEKEKAVLKLLLEEIEDYGINSSDCDFFIVGPVYGLYETMGDWKGAKEFLEYADTFYQKDTFEHEVIQTLLSVVETQINKPFYVLFLQTNIKRINRFCQWYALEIFILFSVLSTVFILTSIYYIRKTHTLISKKQEKLG